MAIIGIFFGSDTGNTENIAKTFKTARKDVADVHDIAKSSKEDPKAMTSCCWVFRPVLR